MVVGRAERRRKREERASAEFGSHRAGLALDLLEIVELAWHDIYDEIAPPDEVIDDIFVLAEGSLEELIRVALLALTDSRDLRLAADERRTRPDPHHRPSP